MISASSRMNALEIGNTANDVARIKQPHSDLHVVVALSPASGEAKMTGSVGPIHSDRFEKLCSPYRRCRSTISGFEQRLVRYARNGMVGGGKLFRMHIHLFQSGLDLGMFGFTLEEAGGNLPRFGRVMPLEALNQPTCLPGWKSFV